MSAPRHLSWENFRSGLWLRKGSRIHRIGTGPEVAVFTAGNGNIGLLVELDKDSALPKAITRLASIDTRIETRKGRRLLILEVAPEPLHRPFYHFASAVADRILVRKESPLEAIVTEIGSFQGLVEKQPLLSIERQIGLAGELVFLKRLIAAHGTGAADAWVGPVPEPHDFRIGTNEYEVKTSSGARRIHRINLLAQLAPSEGLTLVLVSILLEPAGKADGFSLPKLVTEIRRQLRPDAVRSEKFEECLAKLGWKPEDARHYTRVWRLRRAIAAAVVTGKFPRIERSSIEKLLGTDASRIDHVEYDLDVDSLVHEETERKFPAALRKHLSPAPHVPA